MIEHFEAFLKMFALLAIELTVLFIGINYFVLILQEYIPQKKIEQAMSSKNKLSYVYSIILAVITPFCSCSTIPFLKGLIKARAGFGPIMAFLFTSPLLNPIVLGLFVYTFGLYVTITYSILAIVISILGSFILQKLGFIKYIRDEAYSDSSSPSCGCSTSNKKEESSCCTTSIKEKESNCCVTPVKEKESCCSTNTTTSSNLVMASSFSTAGSGVLSGSNNVNIKTFKVNNIKKENKWFRMLKESYGEYKSVFPYLLVGIIIGAAIHGFVPADFIAKHANKDNIFAVPFSAIVGIPLYIRASTLVPIAQALVEKGMSLGAVMALIIGSAGASLTEVIILRSIFKTKIIIAFLIVVLGMAVISGYIFNAFF